MDVAAIDEKEIEVVVPRWAAWVGLIAPLMLLLGFAGAIVGGFSRSDTWASVSLIVAGGAALLLFLAVRSAEQVSAS